MGPWPEAVQLPQLLNLPVQHACIVTVTDSSYVFLILQYCSPISTMLPVCSYGLQMHGVNSLFVQAAGAGPCTLGRDSILQGYCGLHHFPAGLPSGGVWHHMDPHRGFLVPAAHHRAHSCPGARPAQGARSAHTTLS